MIKAIIFDFNGTLFFDTEKHKKAWFTYAEKILNRQPTQDEFERMLGRSNERILEILLNRTPTAEEVEKMGGEKEAYYRSLCLDDRENMHLADGAEELLDKLKAENIPVAIATSSDLENVNFYFEYFGISKWFDRSTVIYNDGTMKGKPAPDIYLRAAERLNVNPCDCVVFEDALSGITAAHSAGVGKIFAIASENNPDVLAAADGVSAVINDYTEISIKDILD